MQKPYYSVDGHLYTNKLDALFSATKAGKSVEWHWHEEFSSLDWQSRPLLPMKEYYKRRAQQLRDAYDWIVLSFSGGSDSWTVLNTFLENNIHLDEIFVYWSIDATKGLYCPDASNTDPGNFLSEWDLTILPALKQISQSHPRIKITIYDVSQDLMATEFNDNLIDQTSDGFTPGWYARHHAIGQNERQLIDSGNKTCFLLGVDKPQMCIKDSQVFCYFIDNLYNTNMPQVQQGRKIELFYWSKDMPQITHCQAREIYNFLHVHPQLCDLIDWKQPITPEQKHIWDRVVRNIIYPDYDISNFQARKDRALFNSEKDWWLSRVIDERTVKRWDGLFQETIKSIDPKYFNYFQNRVSGLQGFISKFYLLGPKPVAVDQ